MKFPHVFWRWLPVALLSWGMLRQPAASAPVQAAPLASPTPDPNIINQPFVIFQTTRAFQGLFRFDSGVPILWTILILAFLLGLVSFYIRSTRPRH